MLGSARVLRRRRFASSLLNVYMNTCSACAQPLVLVKGTGVRAPHFRHKRASVAETTSPCVLVERKRVHVKASSSPDEQQQPLLAAKHPSEQHTAPPPSPPRARTRVMATTRTPTETEQQVAMKKSLRVMNWNADVAALNIHQLCSARESENLSALADDLKPAVSEIQSDPWILFLLDVLDFDTATKVANQLRCSEQLHFEWKLKYELVFALRKKKHMCLRFRDLGWESLRAHSGFRAYVAAAATQQKRELDQKRQYVTLVGSREDFPESKRVFASSPVIISVSDDDGLAGLRFYLRIVYDQETSVLTKLIAIKTNASVSVDTPPTSPSRVTLSLDAAQLSFIETVMRTDGGVHILTGGAGTGKTRTIMGLLQRFDQRTYVCAPTGKAISNIRQKLIEDTSLLDRYECGIRDTYDFEAGINQFEDENVQYESGSIYLSTIHRILYNKKDARQFGAASLVVIDEFSMVDLCLFSRVLAHVDEERHVRLVLVGDDNQLYPVSYGKIMKDVIDSRHIVSSLTQLAVAYRQQTTTTTTLASIILHNASALLTAAPPASWRAILTASPVFRIHLHSSSSSNGTATAVTLWDEVCSFVVDEHRRCRGDRRLQVLCQTNNLCDKINRGVQKDITRYGVDGDAEMYVPQAKLFVRRDDPLICVKNYYDEEIVYCEENINGEKRSKLKFANGDAATVLGWKTRRDDNTLNNEVLYITVEHKTDRCVEDWPEDEFAAHFKLGYAITIHKSQGSEYDAGVVVLDARCRWFAQRSMLYTAITRFKKACFIFAHEDDLDAAVNAPMHLFVIGALQDRLSQYAATTQS